MLQATACGVRHIFERMREAGGERVVKIAGVKGGKDVSI
jgi:hypothetical protein